MLRRPFLAVFVILLTFCAGMTPAEARRGRKRRASRPVKVEPLTKNGLPNVQAKGALIVDLDTGQELYTRDPDTARPIASVGKLFLALAIRRQGLALGGTTTITEEDVKLARGGARSRLPVGK